MEIAAFEESLLSPLEWMEKDREEVACLLGLEAAEMVGFDQRNPHHGYTLFEHTLRTVEALPENALEELRTAAFFHDIGKTACARENAGRLVFYGHAAKSEEISRPILTTMGYEDPQLSRILFYIRHHDDFIFWCLPEE